ncbi:ABC transporter permease [Actinomadura citrea]|uniref:Putative spermidine/putrescine transport system permease protein n=1 Tax=Actinomadura citrea TaxID=46158 RepID=A0A7Y9GEH6_9ACTN|nr:ABC transporter permease subunit [Actinomadura citrea]NYE15043.1 putative spermidine/putrescine transport system permease protein [Actinomadura citrea]GGT84976.1 ABC transporter permease [Actinomadura citrea]
MAVEAPARGEARMPRRGGLRHRLAERGVDRVLLLLAPAVLVVALLFLYPMMYGMGLSLQPKDGGGPFGNYAAFFRDSYQRGTIGKTLRLALPAALINVGASVPIAYRLRGRFRGRRPLTALLVLPVTLGTVLVADGLLRYLGPKGWFNRVLLDLGVVDEPVRLVYNYWGVLFSLLITGFPFAFLLVLAYMSGIDPTLERAAATLGAGPWQRMRRIVLPLLAPGLATTFVLAFVLAFSVFPSANLVGEPAGETRVMAIAAYQAAFEKYDYSMASTIAVLMGVFELLVIAVTLLLRGRLYTGPASGGKGS